MFSILLKIFKEDVLLKCNCHLLNFYFCFEIYQNQDIIERDRETERQRGIWKQFGNIKDLKVEHFFDSEGVIRIKTRQHNFHPVWIPKDSKLAEKIIETSHVERLHSGIRDTIAAINDKYYIPNLFHIYLKILNACLEASENPKISPFSLGT